VANCGSVIFTNWVNRCDRDAAGQARGGGKASAIPPPAPTNAAAAAPSDWPVVGLSSRLKWMLSVPKAVEWVLPRRGVVPLVVGDAQLPSIGTGQQAAVLAGRRRPCDTVSWGRANCSKA